MAGEEGVQQGVDPAAVTQALIESGVLSGDRVTRVEPIGNVGLGRGFLGVTGRVGLRYEGPADGAPATLVVKRPSIDDTTFSLGEKLGIYATERGFYRDLARDCPVRVPRCFGDNAFDGDKYELYLEDLSGARSISDLESCDLDQARQILELLARLHAHYAEPAAVARLRALPWLASRFRGERATVWQRQLVEGFPFWRERFDVAGRALDGLSSRIVEAFPRLGDALDRSPTTLVHGDVRLENLLFQASGGADAIILLDWQLCGLGPAAYDVAYFISMSLTPPVIHEHGDALLRHYHEALRALAPDAPDLESLRADYRRSLLVRFTQGFYAQKMMHPIRQLIRSIESSDLRQAYETQTAAAETLMTIMHERGVAAIEASGAETMLTER